jgi:hypothetical protein
LKLRRPCRGQNETRDDDLQQVFRQGNDELGSESSADDRPIKNGVTIDIKV